MEKQKVLELKILRLIYNYSDLGLMADSFFIDKLIEIVVKHRDLHNHVKTISIADSFKEKGSGVELATYDPIMKHITVNSGSINCLLDRLDRYNFFGFEHCMLCNLHIAQTILHELEHAHQFKVAEISNDLEGIILRASFELQIGIFNDPIVMATLNGRVPAVYTNVVDKYISYLQHERRIAYEESYLINPSERLADARSIGLLLESLAEIKHKVPDLYDFGEVSLYTTLLRGYQVSDNLCPTLSFLSNTGKENVWNSLGFTTMQDITSKYSLMDRLYYGLPIKSSEQSAVEQYVYTKDRFGIN